MRNPQETWAVVLAGGDGHRLRTLTTTADGVVVPKQYCSLGRSSCLLQDAVHRAQSLALRAQVGVVVAAQHRPWWNAVADRLSISNVIVQPRNRGTAYGILLALLTVEQLNPRGIVSLLPANHYFRDEGVITRSLRTAVNLASDEPRRAYLLGTEPDVPDPELGYIIPQQIVRDTAAPVVAFVEKPAPDYANELRTGGALWNLFILVGAVAALLDLFAEHYSSAVADMREAITRHAQGDRRALESLYERTNSLDFSADVLELQARRLKVLRVPPCGWIDLGTRQRLRTALRRLAASKAERSPLFFDLSAARYDEWRRLTMDSNRGSFGHRWRSLREVI